MEIEGVERVHKNFLFCGWYSSSKGIVQRTKTNTSSGVAEDGLFKYFSTRESPKEWTMMSPKSTWFAILVCPRPRSLLYPPPLARSSPALVAGTRAVLRPALPVERRFYQITICWFVFMGLVWKPNENTIGSYARASICALRAIMDICREATLEIMDFDLSLNLKYSTWLWFQS